MIATTDPERKNVYVFADLPTGTVRRLLRTVPGLREWGTAAEQTVQHAPEVRSMPAAFPDTRPAAPAHTTPSTTASTETHEEERVFMPDHAPAKGGGSSDTAETVMKWVAVIVLVVLGFLLIGAVIDGLRDRVGGGRLGMTAAENSRIEKLERELEAERRLRRTTPPAAAPTHSANGATNRLPTPQEVYERQRQSGNVTRTRVPCAEGFFTLPNGNCGRWVQN